MARLCEVGKINWISLTLFGGSFLRILLKNYGYEFDDGLILVADNEKLARRLVFDYCAKNNGTGVYIQKAQMAQYVHNYQIGFMILKKGLKEETILDFLLQKTFLPVLVVGGILPESLRSDRYIFRLKSEDVEEVCDKKTVLEIEGFCDYIIQNVSEVCNIFEKLDSSITLTEYKGTEKSFFSVLAGIGSVYAAYLRKKHSERDVVCFLQEYIRETEIRLKKMSDFACGVEMAEMLSALVWEYLEQKSDTFMADIGQISDAVYEALKANKAVLFDTKYYFFPPKLLMEICEPLLRTASEPELKKELRDEGIIYCNSADYTVKKDIKIGNEIRERPRFIWVKKDALLSPDNLRLEDVFEVISQNEENEEEVICMEIM